MAISVLGGVVDSAVVNVASVPQRSPFRYPGGKTWLVPQVRRWLSSLPNRPNRLIEPFAGGGIVSLTAAFELFVDSVTMVELDEQVAAVWHTIISGDWEWLVRRIANFELTQHTAACELSRVPSDTREKAFQTILRNRVCHGGILAPGSGLLKHGENGKGIRSRWYPTTLCSRIRDIATIRHKIIFLEEDGMSVIRDAADRDDVVFFIDPPYTAAGKKAGTRLYRHNQLDHQALFDSMSKVSGDFLMTYDNSEEIVRWALEREMDLQLVPMKNTHHAEMMELLIGKTLDWARSDLLTEAVEKRPVSRTLTLRDAT